MSRVLDEHRRYLADTPRVDAFRRAIQQVVRPGDVVVDLASGTGILGLLACEAGAARVYAIDDGEITEIARRVIAHTPYVDRITILRTRVQFSELPELADVAVLDQTGHFGFEAGVFDMLGHAQRRFLKPDARTIPQAVTLCVAPVFCEEIRAHVNFWGTHPAGLDFSSASSFAANTGYPVTLTADNLLAPSQDLATVTLPPTTDHIAGQVEATITRDGPCTGIGGWFRAQLAHGVELTNAPGHPRTMDRMNVVFPLTPAVHVKVGDIVSITMRILPSHLIVSWSATINGREHRRGSTFEGMLMSGRDLTLIRPDSRPRLTTAGLARALVLNMSDGAHTVQQIEDRLLSDHPTLFSDRAEAGAFAAEVIAVYAKRD